MSSSSQASSRNICGVTSIDSLRQCSFNDLKGIFIDNIIKICVVELKNSDKRIDVYDFVFTTAVKTIHPTLLEEKIFNFILNDVLDYISKNLQSIIDSTFNQKTEIVIETIISTIKLLTSLIEYLSLNTDDFKTIDIKSLPNTILFILNHLYNFLKNRSLRNENDLPAAEVQLFKKLFKHTRDLQSELLNLLLKNDNQYFTDNGESAKELIFFKQLLTFLCEVGEIIALLDVTSTAEIWKCIIKLSSHNATALLAIQSESSDDCFDWLAKPIEFLCFEITKSVMNIMDDLTFRNIDRTMKINLFYLRILCRFANDFQNDNFRSHGVLIKTLLFLNSSNKLDDRVANLIDQYLTAGFVNVLYLVYKSWTFLKEFMSAIEEETTIAFLNLSLIIMKKMISERNESTLSLYLSSDKEYNIIERIFHCLPNLLIYEDRELYTKLVVNIGALVIINSSNHNRFEFIEELLVKSLLQNNILLCYLSFDIWSLYLRFAPAKQCFVYLQFWSCILKKYSFISHHLSAPFIQNLVQNVYDFLPRPLKQEFLTARPVNENVELWIKIGLNRIENIELQGQIYGQLIDIIVQCADNFMDAKDPDSYFKLIENLKILSTMEQEINFKIPDVLIKLWKMTLHLSTPEDIKLFTMLIVALLQLSSASRDILCSEQHYNIVCCISSIHSKTTSVLIKLKIIDYLRHSSIIFFTTDYRESILNIFTELFAGFLSDPDIIIQEKCLIAFKEVAHKITHDQIIVNSLQNHSLKTEVTAFIKDQLMCEFNNNEVHKFLYKQNKYNFKHKCWERQIDITNEIEKQRKKIKLDTDAEVDVVLNRLTSDVSCLYSFYENNSLNRNHMNSVKDILDILLKIK